MNEARLTMIEQIEQFLSTSSSIEFSAVGDSGERYEHISRVLTRFDYPGRNKREHGVLLRYVQHTGDYSRAQVTGLVSRWQRNRLAAVLLVKRYRVPAAVKEAESKNQRDLGRLILMRSVLPSLSCRATETAQKFADQSIGVEVEAGRRQSSMKRSDGSWMS
jgi:hypothetical protein